MIFWNFSFLLNCIEIFEKKLDKMKNKNKISRILRSFVSYQLLFERS